MKLTQTILLALITLPAAVGCLTAPTDPNTTTGGVAMAGSSGSGGSMAGAAGTMAGAGGTVGSSGGSGQAGAAAGSTNVGGAGAGAGGTSTGAGTGGTAAGGAEAGGSAGGAAAGGGAGGAELTADTLLPGMDGLFVAFRNMNPAIPSETTYSLTNMDEACPEDGSTRPREFQAMGTPGQKYTINYELRGVLSLRCYEGGTPTATTADATATKIESLYVGGTPSGESLLSTLELAITPAVEGETASNYFLNGIPSTAENCDAEVVYDVAYKSSFVILGDSLVTLTLTDPDCTVPQNCGADPAAGCMPRDVDVDGLEVRASPSQPVSDFLEAESFPQWLAFDIQSITTE